jgi:hypothetical protein
VQHYRQKHRHSQPQQKKAIANTLLLTVVNIFLTSDRFEGGRDADHGLLLTGQLA